MVYAIRTQSLCKTYKNKIAIDNISINIEKASIYGLVGENGSGKTTLIKILSGLAYPNSGEIYYSDNLNTVKPGWLGLTIENSGLISDFTAYQNLEAKSRLLGLDNKEWIDELLKLVSLYNDSDRKVKTYSMGMQQRLAIALAIINKPEVIYFDEPLNGLDPQGIRWFRELVKDLNEKYRITFIISSHILSELSMISTHYGFISNGKLIKEISHDDLEKHILDECISFEDYYFLLTSQKNMDKR